MSARPYAIYLLTIYSLFQAGSLLSRLGRGCGWGWVGKVVCFRFKASLSSTGNWLPTGTELGNTLTRSFCIHLAILKIVTYIGQEWSLEGVIISFFLYFLATAFFWENFRYSNQESCQKICFQECVKNLCVWLQMYIFYAFQTICQDSVHLFKNLRWPVNPS